MCTYIYIYHGFFHLRKDFFPTNSLTIFDIISERGRQSCSIIVTIKIVETKILIFLERKWQLRELWVD